MFHPVNGRRGFDLLPAPPGARERAPTAEVMVRMLQREEELRLSAEIQEQFANPKLDTIHVAAEVQKRVAREFGFSDIEETVTWIRSAPAIYPDCPEVKKIPHYQKFNRARDGDTKVGDTIPDATVANLNGIPMTLYGHLDKFFTEEKFATNRINGTLEETHEVIGKLGGKRRKPVVICAGSYS